MTSERTTVPLLTYRDGAVLIAQNNNPAARNALTPAFMQALPIVLEQAQDDPETGAIVLTGVDGVFCSGGDLKRLAARRTMHRDERRAALENLHGLIRKIRDCNKPVIAAVEGAAAGAGLSIALACDMLVSSRSASFSVAYVKIGLTPDGDATAFLAEHASRQLMSELCMTGESVSGERMHALGFVNRLTDSGHALADAIALANRISQGPQRAIARIKALCRSAGENSLDDQLNFEAELMADSLGDEEAAEGIDAFFARRPAKFTALRRQEIDAF